MAYNEKLDAMNSNMAANAAENNSRAMSNFMNLGISTLSNISDIVSKLDEDKANDLIDDANNKMTAYINTSQNEYMYDSDGNIIDDTDAIMSGLYNKADEIANGYSARYRKRISSSLKSSVSSRANSIYSSYADTILNERKTSINSLVQSELAAFDSGTYGEAAVGKYNELIEYVKTHPEDDEMKTYMDSINSKLSGDEDFGDIYADISYGLFLKKCNLNGMSKSERERIYGDNVVKSIYQESLLTGLVYSDNLGYKKQVIDGDMTDEEWIANAIEHDREFGYTINGEKYNYTFEELESRRTKYSVMTNDIKQKAYALYDKAIQAKDDELSAMTESELRTFILENGSPEEFLSWLTSPIDVNGETVSVNRRYALDSKTYSTYYQNFKDAKVVRELYKYIDMMKMSYGAENEQENLTSIKAAIENEDPVVQEFFKGMFGDITDTSDDIVKMKDVNLKSLFALYTKNAIGSNVILGDPISRSMEEVSAERTMQAQINSRDIKSADDALKLAQNAGSPEEQKIYFNKWINLSAKEDEQNEQTNYNNALLDYTEFYFNNNKSYSKLFTDGGKLFDEIADRNGLTKYQRDNIKIMLKKTNIEEGYIKVSDKAIENLSLWYYAGIARNYQYSVDEIEKAAEEFGVDKDSNEYRQFKLGVSKITAEASSTLGKQTADNKIQKYYNEFGSYEGLLGNEAAMSDITEGMDKTSSEMVIKNIEAKAYEEMANTSAKYKNEENKIAYNNIQIELIEYVKEHGNSYNSITPEILRSFENASKLTEEQLSYLDLLIYEKQNDEKENESKDLKNKAIDSAKVMIDKNIKDSVIDSYDEALRIMIDAGASQTDAETYLLSKYPYLYNKKMTDSYTTAVQYIIDQTERSKDFDINEINSWLSDNGYNDKDIKSILSFARLASQGYGKEYSASEIAEGLLGNNDIIMYINNQKNYIDNLPAVLMGYDLENAEKGSYEYLYTINMIQNQCKQAIYSIFEVQGSGAEKNVYKYIRDKYDKNADESLFVEGMDVNEIAKMYMVDKVAEKYIEEYRAFSDNADNIKYDSKRSLSDVFEVDSNRHSEDVKKLVHRQLVNIGAERITIDDTEYQMYSKGGVCYTKILSDILSAPSYDEAIKIFRENDKYLPEAESKELYDALENTNINSLLKANSIDMTFDQIFGRIAGANQNYFKDFSSYIANHPDEFINITGAIKNYNTYAGQNRKSEADDILNRAFTDMYTRFASSIMSTSQPKGILGIKSGDYLIGDILAGNSKSENFARSDKNGKYNDNFGKNRISEFADAIPSINNGNLGENASIRARNIKTNNIGYLSNDAMDTISVLDGLIYDSDKNYKNDEIETYTLAKAIIASGYALDIDINSLETDKGYLDTLKNNVCMALEDINRHASSVYYGDFSTVINSAALLVNDANIVRRYKSISTSFSEGMKFEGFDDEGNIVTRNGSVVKPVFDYGGDIKSVTVTYKDVTGTERTIEDIGLHNNLSVSQILEELGLKTTGSNILLELGDYETKINEYNNDEYALKGKDSYLIIGIRSSLFGVTYKKLSYSEIEKMKKNNEIIAHSANMLKGIF